MDVVVSVAGIGVDENFVHDLWMHFKYETQKSRLDDLGAIEKY